MPRPAPIVEHDGIDTMITGYVGGVRVALHNSMIEVRRRREELTFTSLAGRYVFPRG